LNEKNIEMNVRDQKIFDEFKLIIKDITSDMEGYKFHLASEKIYQYLWHTFADIIIEDSKKIIVDDEDEPSRHKLLVEILSDSLKVLHPFMPFVTEEIWGTLSAVRNLELATKGETSEQKLLIIESWPA
jgi:valyl-tRNA synthetase